MSGLTPNQFRLLLPASHNASSDRFCAKVGNQLETRVMERPDWNEVMKGCAPAEANANDLVQVTRESARLGTAAIERQTREEAYHNFMAAGRELQTAADHG